MTRRSASREARSPAKGSDRSRIYRVRFTEWQLRAINVSAIAPHEAVAKAQMLRHGSLTAQFEQINNGDSDWEAELIRPRRRTP